MEIIISPDSATASREAARFLSSSIRNKPGAVLGLATGSTPVPLYRELIRLHVEEGLDFSGCASFNLDEYVGLGADHPASYRRFMQENLFSSINLPADRIHVPDGLATDIPAHCAAYEKSIAVFGRHRCAGARHRQRRACRVQRADLIARLANPHQDADAAHPVRQRAFLRIGERRPPPRDHDGHRDDHGGESGSSPGLRGKQSGCRGGCRGRPDQQPATPPRSSKCTRRRKSTSMKIPPPNSRGAITTAGCSRTSPAGKGIDENFAAVPHFMGVKRYADTFLWGGVSAGTAPFFRAPSTRVNWPSENRGETSKEISYCQRLRPRGLGPPLNLYEKLFFSFTLFSLLYFLQPCHVKR